MTHTYNLTISSIKSIGFSKKKKPCGLTCAGTKARVISQQPLLLEHSFQVDP